MSSNEQWVARSFEQVSSIKHSFSHLSARLGKFRSPSKLIRSLEHILPRNEACFCVQSVLHLIDEEVMYLILYKSRRCTDILIVEFLNYFYHFLLSFTISQISCNLLIKYLDLYLSARKKRNRIRKFKNMKQFKNIFIF